MNQKLKILSEHLGVPESAIKADKAPGFFFFGPNAYEVCEINEDTLYNPSLGTRKGNYLIFNHGICF